MANFAVNCKIAASKSRPGSSLPPTQVPHFWLQYADDRKAFDPAYSTWDFKEEIRAAGGKEDSDPDGSGEDGKRCRWLRVYCERLDQIIRPGQCPGCDVPPSIKERLR